MRFIYCFSANAVLSPAQVETLLKTQEVNPSHNSQGNGTNVAAPQEFVSIPETAPFTNSIDAPMSSPEGEINNIQSSQTFLTPGLDRTGNFGWDMISLGLEEPLPDREIIDELYVLNLISNSGILRCADYIITETRYTLRKSILICRFYTVPGIWQQWILLQVYDLPCVYSISPGAKPLLSARNIRICMRFSTSEPANMRNWTK